MSYSKKIIGMPSSLQTIINKEALKSNCVHKLGAVITKGRNKVICRGYNDNMRTSFLDMIVQCQHAEMSVATEFINSYVNPNHLKVYFEKF